MNIRASFNTTLVCWFLQKELLNEDLAFYQEQSEKNVEECDSLRHSIETLEVSVFATSPYVHRLVFINIYLVFQDVSISTAVKALGVVVPLSIHWFVTLKIDLQSPIPTAENPLPHDFRIFSAVW